MIYRYVSLCLSSVLLFCFCCQPSFAQSAQSSEAPISVKDASQNPLYAKEGYIVERAAFRVAFQADGTSTRESEFRVRIQSDAARQNLGVLDFEYESDIARVEVEYVRVRKADGSVVETPASNILDMPSPVTQQAPLYSDLKQKQIPVKGLSVGDTLEYLVREVYFKPLVQGQFWYAFNSIQQTVVLDGSLEVRVPAAATAAQVVSPEQKPQVREADGQRIYVWKTTQLKPSTPVDPTKAQSTEPKPPFVQITTFKDWNSIGAWYAGLAQSQIEPGPEVRAKAEELTRGVTDPREKVRILYDYVSMHFRYVGLDFGIGRYQPHTAKEVLDNEYGDCKDKHTLLVSLLKAEGIDAWPALINSGSKIDPNVPSPSQFDHVITVVPLDDKNWTWLDTTAEVAPFGMLLANLRDKQALVVPTVGEPRLVTTPANPPFPVHQGLDVTSRLDATGTLTGKITLDMRGDLEVLFRAVFHAVAESQWQDMVQNLSYRIGYAGTVSNVQVSDPAKTSQPFTYSYDYNRKDFGDWEHLRVNFPLPSIPFVGGSNDPVPVDPVDLGSPGETVYTSSLELPKGYTMSLPEDVDAEVSFAEYHAHYTVKDGVFHVERRWKVNQQKIPVDSWKAYLQIEKKANDDQTAMYDVKKANNAEADVPSTASKTGPSADNLAIADQELAMAKRIGARGNTDEAMVHLEKARAADPHHINLNLVEGVIYLTAGDNLRATAALHREIDQHPENSNAYYLLVEYLKDKKDFSEAIRVLQMEYKTKPEDVILGYQLGVMLDENGRSVEAVPLLGKMVVIYPNNAEAQMQYGKALIAAGNKQEGLAVLDKALSSNPEPSTGLETAAILADSGADVRHARVVAEAALQAEEVAAGKMVLSEEASRVSAITTQQMVRAWNTMADIYLKNDEPLAAEHYATSAWRLSQSSRSAELLGEALELEGKRAEAIHLYQMALVTGSRYAPGGDKQTFRDRLSKLHVTSYGPSGRPAGFRTGTSLEQDLTNQRTIHLSNTVRKEGSAEFDLLVAKGLIEQARRTSGAEYLDAYEAGLKGKNSGIPFPDAGPEKVILHAVLFCSEISGCQLTYVF